MSTWWNVKTPELKPLAHALGQDVEVESPCASEQIAGSSPWRGQQFSESKIGQRTNKTVALHDNVYDQFNDSLNQRGSTTLKPAGNLVKSYFISYTYAN